VKEIRVDDGRVLKRARPAWKGMAHRIRRRRSHIAITLGERERVAKVSKKKVEKEGIDTKNETSDNKEKIKK
jgi:large subunit ribosomal protein L22